MAFGLARPQHGGERARGADHVAHRFGSGRAHQIVGILTLRQQRELQALAGREPRQGDIDGAKGGAQARAVAVEAEHRLVGHLPEQGELVFGERGAERRDGGVEAGRTMAMTST